MTIIGNDLHIKYGIVIRSFINLIFKQERTLTINTLEGLILFN
jgi:hypothetical protein